MIETKEGYKFESTGREFSTHGSDGLSITSDMTIAYGYDGSIFIDEDNEDAESLELQETEKREMAEYMIGLWKKYGNL